MFDASQPINSCYSPTFRKTDCHFRHFHFADLEDEDRMATGGRIVHDGGRGYLRQPPSVCKIFGKIPMEGSFIVTKSPTAEHFATMKTVSRVTLW